MSANIDLVRSIYAAWERGDYSSVEWADPEIEYVIADGPAPGRWTGLSGLGEAWRSILTVWEEFHTESVDEFRELDDQRGRYADVVRRQSDGSWLFVIDNPNGSD
jgi:ketosteroid isomerase-like protein